MIQTSKLQTDAKFEISAKFYIENYFLKFININPDSIEGFFNLGMTNYKLDLLDEAIGNFNEVLKLDDSNKDKSVMQRIKP